CPPALAVLSGCCSKQHGSRKIAVWYAAGAPVTHSVRGTSDNCAIKKGVSVTTLCRPKTTIDLVLYLFTNISILLLILTTVTGFRDDYNPKRLPPNPTKLASKNVFY